MVEKAFLQITKTDASKCESINIHGRILIVAENLQEI